MLRRGVEDEFERALAAFNQSDFAAAIGILTGLSLREPASGEIWLQLGICHLKANQPGEAVKALAEAVRAEPHRASAHFFLGAACGAAGDLERASACLRRALELDSSLARADHYLLQVESLLESRARYLAGCHLLYSSQPTSVELNQALRDLIESVAIYENSPARHNLRECAQKLLAIKKEYQVSGESCAAHEKWRKACRLGASRLECQEWAGARDAYLDALREGPGAAFVYHALGFCFAGHGAPGGAVRAWLRVVETDPEYDFTRFGRV